MKWVTWEYVAVDRMACAWLIRRMIDPNAEFLFIPADQKRLPEGAEPFDIPGVRFSHRGGHCSFYTMIKEYAFDDPVLERIAQIVDEADVIQEAAVESAAPGLDLICRGLRRISPDDQTAIEHGSLVYEALYKQLAFEARA